LVKKNTKRTVREYISAFKAEADSFPFMALPPPSDPLKSVPP